MKTSSRPWSKFGDCTCASVTIEEKKGLNILAYGVKRGETPIDGGTAWVLIDKRSAKGWSNEDILEELNQEFNLGYYYGGPGRYFQHEPFVLRRRKDGRILITQTFGYDI